MFRILFAVMLFADVVWAQTLVVSVASPHTVAGAETYTDVTVESGGVLTIDGTLDATTMTVQAGGRVTHSPGRAGLRLNVAGALEIEAAASINSTAMGLLGGEAGGAFGASAESIDPFTGEVVAGSVAFRGGSYAGLGGIHPSWPTGLVNPVYGAQDGPLHVGSGGGKGSCSGAGGSGGGLIVITAGTLQVHGSITADGGIGVGGCSPGSGGSGGGVSLAVGTLSGAGGISARGGAGGAVAGGGGGRIVVNYAALTFTGSFATSGGTGTRPGAPGTSWLLSSAGHQHFAGGSAVLDGDDVRTSIGFGNGGTLVLSGAASLGGGVLAVPVGATILVESGAALVDTPLASFIEGNVQLSVPYAFAAALTVASTGHLHVTAPLSAPSVDVAGSLVLDAQLDVLNDVNVSFGGLISHTAGIDAFDLRAGGRIDLASGAVIDVTGKGLAGGNGGSQFGTLAEAIDPVTLAIVAGSNTNSGGSHGGLGGIFKVGGSVNVIYGSQDFPALLGSGGGTDACASAGGRGGGKLRLQATSIYVGGAVVADGGISQGSCNQLGGGSGGSVLLIADTLEGNGIISARGGAGGGAGGGGGRIALHYTDSTYSGTVTAGGGTTSAPGDPGTIWAVPPSADAVVHAGKFAVGGADTFASITLLPGAELVITGPVTVASILTVPAGATVVVASPDAFQNATLDSTIEGHLLLQSTLDFAGPVTVHGRLTIDAPVSATELEVMGELVLNHKLTTSGDVSIRNGGVVTHAHGATSSELVVATALNLDVGGTWDVSGRGLRGGYFQGAGNTALTYDPSTQLVVPGSEAHNGGSHGGRGTQGTTNPNIAATYGDALQPVRLGGGGGGGACGATLGGNGGGRILITAYSVVNHGDLMALGIDGVSYCGVGGGGAGGSIWITATELSGAGSILANGGSGAGSGGGGRIAIDATMNSFTGLLQARGGGSGSARAGDGTTFIRGGDAALTISGGVFELTDGDSVPTVTLLAGGTLVLSGAATIVEPLVVPEGTALQLNASDALTNVVLVPRIEGHLIIAASTILSESFDIPGAITVEAPTTIDGDLTLTGIAIVNERLQVANLDMQAGAMLSHAPGEYFMDLVVDGVFNLGLGARVDATALGLLGAYSAGHASRVGQTLDPITFNTIDGSGRQNGGSHGGLGGLFVPANAQAAVYDDPANPTHPGGGGGSNACNYAGGNGGGVVRIHAGVAQVLGDIWVKGGEVFPGCAGTGAGAGGSLYVDFGEFSGGASSTISVAGGASEAGGGGGGLAAIVYATKSYAGTIDANGGTGVTPGEQGVVTETSTPRPPDILSLPPASAAIDTPFAYQPVAVGTDPILWALTQGPTLSAIDAASGLVTWSATISGNVAFEITATNDEGTDTQAFVLEVLTAPVIVSTANGDGEVGAPYVYDADGAVEATGSGPLRWLATVAPAGLTMDPVTGRVAWIPAASGEHTICVKVENDAASDTQCFSVVVVASGGNAPSISSTATLSGALGSAYSYDLDGAAEAAGATPIAWTVALAPAGFVIDAMTGVITWMPQSEGVHGVCIVASNLWGGDQQCFSVVVGNIGGAPKFDSEPTLVALVGVPYQYDEDGMVTASGPPPMNYALAMGPADMSIDASSGALAWTPSVAGNVGVVVTATNSRGSAEQGFTISVLDTTTATAPIIIHSANPVAAVGVPYLFDGDRHLEVGGAQPMILSVTGGPTGFRVDERSGMVSWIPAAPGVTDITVTARNDLGSDAYTFSVDVLETSPPEPHAVAVVTPTSGSAPLTVDVDASQSYAPIGTLEAFEWRFGDDAPLDYDVSTTHTYTDPGSYVIRLSVTDSLGKVSKREETVIVTDGVETPPTAVIVVSQVNGRDALEVTFACACNEGSSPIISYYWDTADGQVFEGQSFTHRFGPGAYEVQLTATDENGLMGRDEVLIQVSEQGKVPPLVVATVTPRSGFVPLTVAYEADHGDFDGSVDTVIWDFGDGRTSTDSRGEVTYDVPGFYQAAVTVVDDDGLTATAITEITATTEIGGVPPQILSIAATTAVVGEAYHYDADSAAAARGTRPLTWSLGKAAGGSIVGLPEGMSIDKNTGQIQWVPVAAGKMNVALIVTNEAGATLQEWDIDVTGETATSSANVAAEGCGCHSQHAPATVLLWGLLALVWRRMR